MKLPDKLDQRAFDVIYRLCPGPLGLGMKQRECAKDLGIGRSSIIRALKRIKKHFPKAWEHLEAAKSTMKRQRYSMERPRASTFSNFSDDMDKIIHKF